jgi:hypothetical protein
MWLQDVASSIVVQSISLAGSLQVRLISSKTRWFTFGYTTLNIPESLPAKSFLALLPNYA